MRFDDGGGTQLECQRPLGIDVGYRKPLPRQGVTIFPARITDVPSRDLADSRQGVCDLVRGSPTLFNKEKGVSALARREIEGLLDNDAGNVALEILKSIYGLRTAQSQWQQTLLAACEREGLQRCQYTDCIITGTIDGHKVIIITFVDDCPIISSKREGVQKAVKLIQRHFKCGEPAFLEDASESSPWAFVGHDLHVSGTAAERKLVDSQVRYVKDIVERHPGIKPAFSLTEEHYTVDWLMADVPTNPVIDAAAHK